MSLEDKKLQIQSNISNNYHLSKFDFEPMVFTFLKFNFFDDEGYLLAKMLPSGGCL